MEITEGGDVVYAVVERVQGLAENLVEFGVAKSVVKKALGAIAAVIPNDPSKAGNMPVGGPIYELCRWGKVVMSGSIPSASPSADVQYTKGDIGRAVQAKWVNSTSTAKVKSNISGAVSQLKGMTASGAQHQVGNQELPPNDAVLLADIVIPEDSEFAVDQNILRWLGNQNKDQRKIQIRITTLGPVDQDGDPGLSRKQFIDIENGVATVRPAPDKLRDHVALTATLVAEIQAIVRRDGTETIKAEFRSLAKTF